MSDVVDPNPWMAWLIQHIGEVEKTGSVPTDFDKLVFSHTNYNPLGNSLPPSCAATACAALELTGYKSPHNAAALSFESYGEPLSALKPGCIVVFQFSATDHHVSFFEKDIGEGFIQCVGGNQGSFLKRAIFPKESIIATRWPVKIPDVK